MPITARFHFPSSLRRFVRSSLILLLFSSASAADLTLPLRARTAAVRPEVIVTPAQWSPTETAVIVCDVWDQHWCKSANSRLALLLPRMNQTLNSLRNQGVLVIHAPSDTMKYYENTPQRVLAKSAPRSQPPAPKTLPKEPPLPIDDSDGGCDCQPQCQTRIAWKSQHATITIAPNDAISDHGPEIYNLLASRKIKHVLILGVHTNMCILGRSFAIRQLLRWRFDVALVRDLTDTMYNSRRPPVVPHNKGTDLVIQHIEKHLCPTIHSADILRDPKPPHIVLAIGEDEYDAKSTLPAFAKTELEKRGYRCTVLQANQGKTHLPNASALDSADLLILYLRRTTLPADQLNHFKQYFASGKPAVALRTSCHAFQNWLEFDRQVLSCHYTGHFGKDAAPIQVRPTPTAKDDPLLRNVSPLDFQSQSWLYRLSPLAADAIPLLTSQIKDNPPEPVAHLTTHLAAPVFFTSLGHPDDFKSPQFRRLLLNAIEYTLDHPIAP